MVKPKLLFLGLVCLLVAAGPGFAQTVSIVSGQGQVTSSFTNPFFEPLVVMVKDASGQPLANATVTWTVTQGQGAIQWGTQTTTTVTDGTGQTWVPFQQQAPLIAFGIPYVQSVITATAGASTVTFYETTATLTQSGGLQLSPVLIQPMVGTTISGRAGEQLTGAVQVQVGAPNVELHLNPVDTGTGTTLACASTPGQPAGVVLSDASGVATCNVVFGGRTGTGQFSITVGGNFQTWSPFNFEVASGLPCIIRLLSGNNQTGNAGQILPAPLLAEVTDCGGNPLGGVPVTWSVTRGAGTLTNARNTSSTTGQVSTNLTLGSQAGPVDVRVAVASGTQTANNAAVSATFNATVNLVISQLQKISGDQQEAAQNAPFGQPLVVQVNNQGVPVAGVTVSFAVASGSGTVNTASATTNAQGQASTTVTAGPNAGPLVVSASIGTLSQQFNLTVRPPGPSNITFYNGAGFQRDFIAPCGIATIRGSGLAPGIQGTIVPNYVGPLPMVVANVSVQFGNSFAPIFHVSNINGQQSVTVQVPCEVAPGTVPVIVRVGSGSAQFSAQVSPAAPGIFEFQQSDGRLRGVILKPDGSYATIENPVRKGEIVRMFVTGLGPVTPAVGTNSPGIPDVESSVPDIGKIVVGVNNGGVRVISAKYAAGLIGVYEVAFEVPSDVPAGSLPLAVAVYQGNTLLFGNPSSIYVQ